MKQYRVYQEKSRRHQLKSLRREAECYLAFELEELGFAGKFIRRFIGQINQPATVKPALKKLKAKLSGQGKSWKRIRQLSLQILDLRNQYNREFPQKSKQ